MTAVPSIEDYTGIVLMLTIKAIVLLVCKEKKRFRFPLFFWKVLILA